MADIAPLPEPIRLLQPDWVESDDYNWLPWAVFVIGLMATAIVVAVIYAS